MTTDKELKDQRVPIMMSPSELEAIDDWMFKNRIRSRGEAIRRLCNAGLIQDERDDLIARCLEEISGSLADTIAAARMGGAKTEEIAPTISGLLKAQYILGNKVGTQSDIAGVEIAKLKERVEYWQENLTALKKMFDFTPDSLIKELGRIAGIVEGQEPGEDALQRQQKFAARVGKKMVSP